MVFNKLHTSYLWLALLTALGIALSSTIDINDNALDLLPGEAVRGDLTLLQQLGLVNRVIITLSVDNSSTDTDSLSLLQTAARSIGQSLEKSEYFTDVIYHLPEEANLQIYDEILKILPLLLGESDFKKLDFIVTDYGIISGLSNVFNLLNSPAGYGVKQQVQLDPLAIGVLFLQNLQHLKAEYSLDLVDGLFISKDRKSALLIAESTRQLTDADAATFIQDILDEIFTEALPDSITPRIIGSLPHTLANAHSVKQDLRILLPVATFLLLSLLLLAFRSLRALLVLAIPFLAAPMAIAVTAMIFSQISALALGFGIVLLGIAVDFSIHLYVGLRNSTAQNRSVFLKQIRKPILLATLTTSSVFIVLLFSNIPSHRQMATLAISGILLAVCYSWLLIPNITPHQQSNHNTPSFQPYSITSPVLRWIILLLWVSGLTAGALCWSDLEYNGNLQTLDAPGASVIEDENHFKATWGGTGEQAFVVAHGNSLEQALNNNYHIYKELKKTPEASFQSLAPLLPSLLDQKENREQWISFWNNSPGFVERFIEQAAETGFSETAFSPFLHSLSNPPLPHDLHSSLPDGFKMIIKSMMREVAPVDNTPSDNNYLITTTVTVDESLYQSLLQLDAASSQISLLANKKWREQVEQLLKADITRLSLAAAIVILLITLVSFRSLRIAAGVLAPVLSALSAMAIFSALNGRELNMMHLLMGIMVIGLAVDYGIFTACTIQNKGTENSRAAISICALSSLIGFGVLSFAQHPALESLGVTVLVGIGAAWPTAIIVSPVILGERKNG